MTASSPVKIHVVPVNEKKKKKKNTLLQGSDGRNSSGEISRLPLNP